MPIDDSKVDGKLRTLLDIANEYLAYGDDTACKIVLEAVAKIEDLQKSEQQ